MSFEDELRSDLGGMPLPETLAPPTDLANRVLVGLRQQARRRTLVAAGALIVAVVAAGATAPAWLSPQPGPGPADPTPTAPIKPACDGQPLPSRSPSSGWEHFDPLTYAVDASNVTGFEVKTAITSTYYQGVELVNPARDRYAAVILYAAAGDPHYIDGNDNAVPFDPGAGAPAGSVNGAPAFWLPDEHYFNVSGTSTDNTERGLAWQWTPGAWALVLAGDIVASQGSSTVDPAELRTIASQVAPQLELGTRTPVTAPFAMPVPACTRVALALTSHEFEDDGTPFTIFALGFNAADKAESTHPPAGDIQVSLLVTADTASAPTSTSGLTPYPEDLGYPAYTAEGVLSVYEVSGFAVNIVPFDLPDVDTDAEKAALGAGIFHTMTIHPNAATNESAWLHPIAP